VKTKSGEGGWDSPGLGEGEGCQKEGERRVVVG
jgi:hypothetical protein